MTGIAARPSFGVELHEYLDPAAILDEVRLAEELGYDAVWLGDSQLIWREMYVLLGAAAATTQRVALGSGVTNPFTRHMAVTASALVTLQELSGGRVLAGVGLGDSALAVLGQRPVSMAALEAFVAGVRGLAEGEAVRASEVDLQLVFGGPAKCPPIVVAASGPKMLGLAGRIGDGVIVTRQARAGATLSAMLGCVREGREASLRRERPFRTCLSASVAVHPDRTPALQAVRPHVASTLRARLHWELSPAAALARERIVAAYDMYEHMNPAAAHAGLVPDDVIPEFAIAGTADECIEQALGLFQAGVDEITIRPYGVDGAPRSATMVEFAHQVMAPVLDRARRQRSTAG